MPFSNVPRPSLPGRLPDFVAGLVVFLVAIPLCLGLAHACKAPLHAGLISGILGGLLVGALSGSPISVTGPAAGLSGVLVYEIQQCGSFEAFLCAVIVAGALQIVLGIARGGALANFIPGNVTRGLLASIGIVFVLKQLPHLLGVDTDYEGDLGFDQPDKQNTFSEIAYAVNAFLPGPTLVGLTGLAVMLLWSRSKSLSARIPAPLAALATGLAVSEALRATGSAWAIQPEHLVALPVVGEEGVRMRDLLHAPDFAKMFDAKVIQAGFTIAIFASLESLLNLQASDKIDPLRRVSPPNLELVAQGVGNLAAGLLGGLPMATTIIRSSVNAHAGGRTKLATMTHGALLLLSIWLVPGLLNRIPLSALAAVLIATGFRLASPAVFRAMAREGKAQAIPFVVTIVAILFTDMLVGVAIGLMTSLAFILASSLRRGFHLIHEGHVGGLVHRIELASQTSFLNRARLANTLARFKKDDQVVLDARLADYIDPDILSLMQEFATVSGPARGVRVSTMGFQQRYPMQDVVQFVDWTTREIQASLTPDRVVQLLRDGNERFLTGRRLSRDLARQIDATAEGQHPMAVVLSCIDSRSAAELLFDVGLGDIFNCRLAGNVASERVLGSMEFACKVAGAKLIVVLGHTSCGAVKASCDFVAKGVDAMTATGLTNLGFITDTIAHAVKSPGAHSHIDGPCDASNKDFVDSVAAENVRLTMRWIQKHSPVLATMLEKGEIGMIGAMYDISTGRVDFLHATDDPQKAR
jgi:MFS superfamily sulfate permease-like transporter